MKNLLVAAGTCALLALPAAEAADMTPTVAQDNPLLAPWSGPYGGVPPFDRARVDGLAPALEAGMAQQLAEVDRIANDPAAPTFANTLAALERTGRTLDRVSTVYGIYVANLNDDAVQVVEREMSPKLAAFSDRITQNATLFERIAKVYETRTEAGLTPEQQRLSWLYYTNFVRAGAKLDAPAKQRLSEINQELAGLFTQFGQNVLKDENEQAVLIEREADLAGLPPAVRDGMAQVADARGHKGSWAVANTRSSVEPFLTYAENRPLREQVWRMFIMRGDNGGPTDNNATITRILQLRAERARVLGYPTHAHWRLENSMAKTPDRAMDLMQAVWPAAVGRVHEEVADMQKIADAEHAGIRIEPWTIATTPKRSASRSTTSTSPRSRPICSSTSCATACSTWRGSCSASTSGRWPRAGCRSITPTYVSGKSTIRRAASSGCGTSTRTRARASARAPG